MKSFNDWTFRGILIFFILVICLTMSGKVTFGYGLGDMVNVFILLIGIGMLIFIRKFLGWQNDSLLSFIFSIIFIAILIFIILKISIWRGPEYRWDGNFFTIK